MHLRPYSGRVYRNFATLLPSQNLMDDLTENAARQKAFEKLYYFGGTDALRSSPVERVLGKSEDQIIQEEIDGKFRPETWRASRYSDGTWAVLYAAESEETALWEALYHMRKFYREELKSGPIEAQRRVLGLQITSKLCRDLSLEKDLNWRKLRSPDESGYPYCQALAGKSVGAGAEMLRAPSARDQNGFCTPIFRKSVIARDEGHLKYLRCTLQSDGTASVTGLIEEETKYYRIES